MIIGIDASRANEEQKTGVGSYAYNVILQLKKEIPPHVKVILYSREQLKGDLGTLPENWENKVLNWAPKYLWTQIRMSLEMLFHKPDILFVPAHVFPVIRPKRTVMMVHDVAAMRFPEGYNFFQQWYSLWSAKKAEKKLWKIIVPSKFTKEELLELQKGDSNKIHVVHHGYNNDYKKIIDIEELNYTKDKYKITKPFLLSVSRLEEKKNTVGIIKSFNILKETEDVQLVLIGNPGFGYPEVIKEIGSSKFKEDIIQPGWVSQEDIVRLLNSADVFVFPSLYEGFGLPALEAFACGAPVVTSIGHAVEEVVEGSALCVDARGYSDIADAIKKLLNNEGLRESLINQGYHRLEHFSWEKTGKETADILLSR